MPGLGLGLGGLGLQILQARARALGAGPKALSPGLGPGFLLAKDKKQLLPLIYTIHQFRATISRTTGLRHKVRHLTEPKPPKPKCRERFAPSARACKAWRAWHFSSPSPEPAQALCRARLGLTKPGPGSARPEGLGRARDITNPKRMSVEFIGRIAEPLIATFQ
ncbi:hypothetical protein B0H16DRAFT_1473568 [Mycena metata]|uniref:Uncharacterized protein n=1 Tax=Mycena metata TaxID=1033252 RepID=A0AAD7HJ85_9AGAR|nr:hypothetical protein B0H16DRAFT_1473568 [Mycena metata]